MDKHELAAWQKITQASKHNWILDRIQQANHGVYLFYMGGEAGNYLEIQPDGTATIGTYEGALPHIGEAMFCPKHSRKVAENADDALGLVLPRMGMQFLLNLIGCKF